MDVSLNLNRVPCSLVIHVVSAGPKAEITGYDPSRQNTVYFNRELLDVGVYTFNMPQSPKTLKVLANNVVINSVKVEKLNVQPLVVDSLTAEFIRFAQDFSEKAGYGNTGKYYSKRRNFVINYFDVINDNPSTPSRIHVVTNEIDAAKKWFEGLTVAGRMALLLHEFSHNYLDNPGNGADIEEEADENALYIYESLGYPKMEWMYVWTEIFSDRPDHIDRIEQSFRLL